MVEPARDPTALPVRTTDDWECEDVDGVQQVSIQRPRHARNRVDGFFMELFDTPTDRELDLDAVGSTVWLHCDGSTMVEEIASQLDATFPTDRIEPVAETLSYFLQQLAKLGLVRFKTLE